MSYVAVLYFDFLSTWYIFRLTCIHIFVKPEYYKLKFILVNNLSLANPFCLTSFENILTTLYLCNFSTSMCFLQMKNNVSTWYARYVKTCSYINLRDAAITFVYQSTSRVKPCPSSYKHIHANTYISMNGYFSIVFVRICSAFTSSSRRTNCSFVTAKHDRMASRK